MSRAVATEAKSVGARPRPIRYVTPRRHPARMRSPDRWLAALRIVVGLWFLKSVATKLVLVSVGAIPLPTASARWIGFLPTRLGELAAVNPIGWYHDFLVETVIPNAPLFAQLTAFGETLVGLGLALGLLTGYASLGMLFLMGNYWLASAGDPLNQQGVYVLLAACAGVFLAARAGRRWGVDGWLHARFPVPTAKIPLI